MKHIRLRFLILSAFAMCAFTGIGQDIRPIDGYNANPLHPEWGAAGSDIIRYLPADYSDGIAEPGGSDRPNPRDVSNILFAQDGDFNAKAKFSDFVWVFGQFIDHDVTLIEVDHAEPVFVNVPECDPMFDPDCDGIAKIPMFRSIAKEGTGTEVGNPRGYRNEITAYLDGSAVYGSSLEHSNWLRTFEGGRLKVSEGNLLPWNTIDGSFNAPRDVSAPFMGNENPFTHKLFVAGDPRANENLLLTAMHTLFVREHNFWADSLSNKHPDWDDERLFQESRRIVAGILQSITYNEWLPALGVHLPAYQGFDPEVNPNISVLFSAAAFRMGHTLLSSRIIRMDNNCDAISQGHTTLKEAFFNPRAIIQSGGLDPLFKGMSAQIMQAMDCKIIDDVRNFLFGPPGAGLGMDLASININRAREMGLPGYNDVRLQLGMNPIESFTEVCSDLEVAEALEAIYGDVDKIDPWVGLLAEDHMEGALFGPSIMHIMEMQFGALRDGDPFYYENDPALSVEMREMIRSTKLHDLVMRNTDLKFMQENVFIAEPECHNVFLIEKPLDMRVYPNPTPDYFNLAVFSLEPSTAEMRVYNHLGQLVIQDELELDTRTNVFRFALNDALPSGTYIVELSDGNNVNRVQLQKIK